MIFDYFYKEDNTQISKMAWLQHSPTAMILVLFVGVLSVLMGYSLQTITTVQCIVTSVETDVRNFTPLPSWEVSVHIETITASIHVEGVVVVAMGVTSDIADYISGWYHNSQPSQCEVIGSSLLQLQDIKTWNGFDVPTINHISELSVLLILLGVFIVFVFLLLLFTFERKLELAKELNTE